ncbi:MAG: hypothetical protein ACI9LM_001775 [Alteromonadaceae bacterium]|jgi:hypothetical protein
MGSHNVFIFQEKMAVISDEHGFNTNSALLFTVRGLDEKIK